LIRPRGRRLATSVRAFVLPLFAGLALMGMVATSVSAASFSATASVSASIQYVNDHAGTIFTFTVKNTGATPIGAVEIGRPSASWTITACPDAPTGWSVTVFSFKCRYTSPAGPARDLTAGHSSNHFQLRARVRASINDLEGRWTVVVSRTSSFGAAANLRTATTFPRGLTTTARSLQILDALVLDAPATVGAPCPVATSANHSAVAGSTGHTVVICGRNRSNVVLTPLATSFLGGTMIASHGGFSSGPIGARTAGSVVLGNWASVKITPDVGSGKTIVGRLVAAGLRHTSHLVTLTGYTALNTPPIAELESASTNEDTASSPITLRATDANGHAMTFGIVAGPAHGTLDPIVPAACAATPGVPKTCTATVVYHPAANYNGSDIFTYRATDSLGASSVPVFVTITIAPVNDAPIVGAHTFSLAENSANASPVGTATYTDPDTGQTHVFSITAGNTGGAFAINSSTGAITVANGAALDYETNPAFSLTVRVTDNGSPVLFGSGTITVNLANVNEAPIVGAHTFSLAENSANATPVGTATYTDPDAGQTHVFSITAGNTGGAFAINSSTGAITVANSAALNYETNPSFSLTVQVTDNGSPVQSGSGTITVNLTDVNEAPVVSPATFSLAENSANATAVGTVAYSDPDTGQTHVYAITAGNTGGAFAINSSTGAITVANSAALDYETNPSFSLTVRVTDNGSPVRFGSTTITVNVTNVNEKPVITAPASVAGALGTEVWVTGISVADPDAGSDNVSLVFAVSHGTLRVQTNVTSGIVPADVSGNDSASVTVTASLAKINATLADAHGLIYQSDSSFSGATDTLTINANDLGHNGSGGSQTDSASVTINLNAAPVANNQTVTTDEDTAKTITLTGSDADAGDVLSYKITSLPASGALYDGLDTSATHITAVPYALASDKVTYLPPANANGTPLETFQFVANDTHQDSAAATVTANVTAVNDPPEITTSAGSLAYTENATTAIDPGLTVTDIDDTNLELASVYITTCNASQDALGFVNQNGITGVYTVIGCTLTLSGTATVADYQAALRSVTYHNTSDTPDTTQRTVTFNVNDGDATTSDTRAIDITAVDDAPVVTTSGGNTSYFEGTAAVTIDSTVTVTDPDSTNIANGQVRISANFQSGDSLVFVDQNGITGVYSSGTGVLALTGSASLADYQTALQSVTFVSTNDTPTATKTIEFKVNDGALDSNLATKSIDVTPTDDPPVVTTSGGPTAWTEGAAAAVIDSAVTVTDPDDTNLEGAVVRISVGFQTGDDLQFVDQNGITGSYVPGTGVLTLSGSSSKANYQTALAAVKFTSSNDNPSASKTIEFKVNDGDLDSSLATKDLDITPVNDAPVVATTAGSLAYTENDPASAIDSAIAVSDPDSATLAGATVQITTGCTSGEDVLALASPPSGITVDPYASGTCTLTLSGAKAPSVYETALRGVTYANTSDNPSVVARTVTFTVDDGSLTGSDTRGITVTAVNDPPTVSDVSHAVTGNIGISVAAPGVLAGVTDPEGNNGFTAELVSAPAAFGDPVINADGSYTFNPKAGRDGLDTVRFRVCDDGTPVACSAPHDLKLTVTGMIWFIDNNAGSAGNGEIATPFNTLAGFQAINDGVDTASTFHPASADTIFLYRDVATDYTGGLTLLDNQKVIGAGATASVATISGITLAPDSVPSTLPATGGVRPNITGGLVLGSGNTLRGLALGNATTSLSGAGFGTLSLASGIDKDVLINTNGRAVNLDNGTISGDFISTDSTGGVNNILLTNVGTVGSGTDFGSGALSGASADSVVISNGGGAFVIGSEITATAGKSVNVNGKSSGSVVFSGHVVDNGHGVSLTSNGTAIIKFLGDLDVSSGTHAGFTATGGGTVAVTGAGNTIVTTTGTALNVANTTIGSDGLTFHDVSANGGTSGIVLNNTGVLGGLTITGDGTNNNSGGTIQNITGTGIALTTTKDVSLSSMNIHDTSDSGVSGTGVTNFVFVNGTINNSGNSGFESNIAFNSSPTTANNIAGTLTVTGSTLTNAWYSGLDVQSGAGTISNATVSNNMITSSTSVASSQGFGINFVGVGTVSTVFSLTKATIDNNTIANFPSAAGIQVSVANTTATGTGPTAGTPGSGDVVEINGNTIHGATALNRMGTQAIAVVATGGNSGSRAKANFTASNNTINDVSGTVILVGNNTYADMTGTIDGNTIVANHQADFISGNGIGGGNGLSGGTNAATPNITLTVTNNNISATDGNGILLVGRGTSGSAAFKIQNNTVGAPVASIARQGIRVDAGNGGSADDSICLNISGNSSAGSSTAQGIGLRKQGTVATTNDFGINGLTTSPASGAQAAAYVAGLNPAGGGVDIVSGDNFVACSLP